METEVGRSVKQDDIIYCVAFLVVAFVGYNGHDGAAGILAGMAAAHKAAAVTDDKFMDKK